MTAIASIEVSPAYDLPAIVRAAKGDPLAARYEDGCLYVPGVTQAKLNAALAAYDPASVPPPPVVPVITFKADVIRRCTDDEADALDAALANASSKLRRLYNDIIHIDHSAAEFPVLHDAILNALTQIMPADQAAVRTTILLMPSE